MAEQDMVIDRIIEQEKLRNPVLRPPSWSEFEDQYLRDNYLFMTDFELGIALGRSEQAVHVRRERELDLPARSKHPDIITSNRIADILGIDRHKVSGWIDAGFIPEFECESTPEIRLVRRIDFMLWMVNVSNWIYFDIEKVTDSRIKRILQLRKQRWGDEWWSSKQVAEYWGVDTADVKRYLQSKRMKGVQTEYSLGGRHHNRKWKNWFILRSEAVSVPIRTRTRRPEFGLDDVFTERADAFILKAFDELKLNSFEIARLMKVKRNLTVLRRYHQLKGDL